MRFWIKGIRISEGPLYLPIQRTLLNIVIGVSLFACRKTVCLRCFPLRLTPVR